ncbi:MAG: nucleotidyl transferase AbiEii/AbiGii toxin family protein [Candidatus Udaeobacter sp.]
MTLDQHPEFRDLIIITADELRIIPELVEKDYWVTRVLRALAADAVLSQQVIFKGGTSLSKGYKLIDRFSEDVDLLTTGPGFSAAPGKAARAALFQQIIDRVERETPLRRPSFDGVSQDERDFLYLKGKSNCNVRFPLLGRRIGRGSNPVDYVFLEMGFRGSPNPTETRSLNSFVGEAILGGKAGQVQNLREYTEDFSAFDFVLLHPTRTLVEKLLALHSSLLKGLEHVRTRHYSDVHSLFTRHPEMRKFLEGPDFRTLAYEAIEIGNENFKTNIDPDLNLAESPALNLKPEQVQVLERRYRGEARYYFKGQVPFREIIDVLPLIRTSLTTK